MTKHRFDPTLMPSPGRLREATGFHVYTTVGANGIRYAGYPYSNEFLRHERRKAPAAQVVDLQGDIEIIVDPFDLGGITLCTKEGPISIPCVDDRLRGVSLREVLAERTLRRQMAEEERVRSRPLRDEAHNSRQELLRTIMRSSGIGILGYTQAECERGAKTEEFGKGLHEEPFTGRGEYHSPLETSFPTEGPEAGTETSEEPSDADATVLSDPVPYSEPKRPDPEPEIEEVEEAPDGPTSMDMFRTANPRRKRHATWGEDG